ncbi:uncharacterized mitochondrial protein AtMg00810-like [Malania oleifera]|uniref:uncharacterized mitochondrial protein AtMg00810-like n=1 Tax=Malania oleifera TaxID=397392 RepID=UPI0025AE73B6|nr:uncharacterized mitochondrial protein AtMg00810-like [Malania oleifera]
MVVAHHLSAASSDFDDPSLYQSLVGALQYLIITRSDIAHVVTVEILAYSDANWAGCLDTRRSIFGYEIYFGDNLVSWSSKKQPMVSRSNSESKYRALALIAAEVK